MAARDLAEKYPSYADKAIFVELLAEGGSHSVQAEASHLDAWVGAQEIPFTSVIDPPGVGMRIVQEIAPRETTFVVELSTMKVLSRAYGTAQAYAHLNGL